MDLIKNSIKIAYFSFFSIVLLRFILSFSFFTSFIRLFSFAFPLFLPHPTTCIIIFLIPWKILIFWKSNYVFLFVFLFAPWSDPYPFFYYIIKWDSFFTFYFPFFFSTLPSFVLFSDSSIASFSFFCPIKLLIKNFEDGGVKQQIIFLLEIKAMKLS